MDVRPDATDDVLSEIRALRDRLPDVKGLVVATVDGLLVAHDSTGLEVDTVAAMSAAQLGLGRQIARAVSNGDFLENVTRTTHGYVAVFAVGQNALLTVVAGSDLNLGRLHYEARPVAERVTALLASAARS
ncbi:diacylglyceryl transferase [Micromonospora sp. HSS6-12]|uniref:Diacylglyceryl transferase n=1 Tax=Micromonospora thermarum TaxID=2720024 RepID=A0ABX0ZAL9_9ACTN|nr:diacylglyceryl transferase [Micromonospora thermarum]